MLPILALAPLGRVSAEEIRPRQFELRARDEVYVLSGGFEVELGGKLEDALHHGVTLTFVQAFTLERPRPYWFDEDVAEASRTLRLSHNALLRSYSLGVGGLATTYESLPEALAALGSVADWAVIERRQIRPKTAYLARVRMYLDLSQLPKPLQVYAFASDRWRMDSGPFEWVFRP